ncbi:MAG: molecular chaperone HtpG [Bacteroidetes bacterium CG23_combo_of_CG06-09_8_20_14_all_32_9]|nr:MAG: molecular chaperone HtpG [Bacteroidetes bacterium CG23_combo_of_CG06-09_8_20_14_all_32_9]
MQKGSIGVTTENIFPIIKKFLYSEHEIFLRELVSNAIDATNKLKISASHGEYKGNTENLKINVSVDKGKNTLTISDYGIGMTAEEVDKYINQIAFSGAGEFLEKYKDNPSIIGHFGLGFYSIFMVAKKVELITLSYKEGAKSVKWTCDGSPEFTIEDTEKSEVGTTVILYLDDDNKEFTEETKINELLSKYCKFLPIEIAFGKEKEWKDGKYKETGKDHIINNTKPLWIRKPAELKEEDYNSFYKELYPASFDEPLFNIHINVDYPFNLTGILYFPKIRNNFEIQKNKIQLYCHQVFVTNQIEGIVPDFLTLLHGVIDSPDIPLNVSRSFLQGDPNVKKISSHVTKKVADRLQEIFKNQRSDFEKKWDDLKIFIQYGMISDDKFYERAEKFVLLKNIDDKCFTLEEYEKLIKANQTDKHKNAVYLYATNKEEQYTYIDAAKNKGYDVLFMDGQLDAHFINHLESKLKNTIFKRVDADTIEKLIEKEEIKKVELTDEEQTELRHILLGALPKNYQFFISFEALSEKDSPLLITRSEYMRRMKDMSMMNGGQGMYGNLPDSYSLIVNTNHTLLNKLTEQKNKDLHQNLEEFSNELNPLKLEKIKLDEILKDKKEKDILPAEKDKKSELSKKIEEIESKKHNTLEDFGKNNKIVNQLIDIALLSHNLLKGEALNKFVKRSVELIK